MPTKAQSEFVKKLKLAADALPHEKVAAFLGKPCWQIRNWLYRDHPREDTIKLLQPKLDRLKF